MDRFGAGLLRLECGPLNRRRRVSSVSLHEPGSAIPIERDTILLDMTALDAATCLQRVRECATAGASALVVRSPVPQSPELTRTAAEHQIAVLGLAAGASWMQIATFLVQALQIDGLGMPAASTDPGTDLFELANSLAALLHAPITIEDLSSRVLAFSADQAGTDEARRLTILGLRVPDTYSDMVRRQGIFRKIYASDRPVFMAYPTPDVLPRVAMRVKAGDELLGSIWAIVPESLSPHREQGMVEAARVVALTMLRARVAADATQRLRSGLVSQLLEGGTRAREAAQQLNMGDSPACVIAVGAHIPDGRSEADEAQDEARTQRTANAFSTYLQPIHPRAIAARLGGVIYAVLPLRSTSSAEAAGTTRGFVQHGGSSTPLYAGIGPVVTEIADLTESRRGADAALRVLRTRRRDGDHVAEYSAIQIEALLLRVSDALVADHVEITGPLAELREYDRTHESSLVATLRAWLDHFGDVTQAAAQCHVHKNTFRYRLSRIEEVAGIDLGSAETRFGLMLQLRVHDA